jgi:hypothetical protein
MAMFAMCALRFADIAERRNVCATLNRLGTAILARAIIQSFVLESANTIAMRGGN